MPAYMIHPFNPWCAVFSGRQQPSSCCMPLDVCPPSWPARHHCVRQCIGKAADGAVAANAPQAPCFLDADGAVRGSHWTCHALVGAAPQQTCRTHWTYARCWYCFMQTPLYCFGNGLDRGRRRGMQGGCLPVCTWYAGGFNDFLHLDLVCVPAFLHASAFCLRTGFSFLTGLCPYKDFPAFFEYLCGAVFITGATPAALNLAYLDVRCCLR